MMNLSPGAPPLCPEFIQQPGTALSIQAPDASVEAGPGGAHEGGG
jgi:hypothetical protein